MPNRKISELTLATSSLPTDGLVIQRGASNLRLEASNFSTGGGDTGSLVETSSISGTTITFTKGDGSTYTNEIVSASHAEFAISASYAVSASVEIVKEVSSSYADTASYAVSASLAQLSLEAISSSYAISASHAEVSDEAISASYAITASHATSTAGTLSNGTSVDSFSFDGSTDVTVDISTYSASVSTDRTNLSASLTTTDQTISSSVASLSGSASDARNQLAADYIAADTALSSSLTTTDQTISASVATLSGSASTAREDLKSELEITGTDGQTIRFNGTSPEANSVLYNDGTNIGINTTAPAQALDVHGGIDIDREGVDDEQITLRNTGAGDAFRLQTSRPGGVNTTSLHYFSTENSVLKVENKGSGAITFQVEGQTDMQSNKIVDVADPTAAQDAATKNYVDGLITTGTNGQTIRFNGTTPTANSVLFNNGTNVAVGNTSPKSTDKFTVTDGSDTRVRIGRTDLSSPDRDFLEIRSNFESGSIISANEHLCLSASSGGPGVICLDAGTRVEFNTSQINANSQIKQVTDPTADQDAATKKYVDDRVRVLQFQKDSTQTATGQEILTFATASAVSIGTAFGTMATTGIFTFSVAGTYRLDLVANSSAGTHDDWGLVNNTGDRFLQFAGSGLSKYSVAGDIITVSNGDNFRYFIANGTTFNGASSLTTTRLTFTKLD